jgi:hypothetical protein
MVAVKAVVAVAARAVEIVKIVAGRTRSERKRASNFRGCFKMLFISEDSIETFTWHLGESGDTVGK